MNFGQINHYMLFGGGTLLRRLALEIQSRKKDLMVVTSPRHAEELSPSFGEGTLEAFLAKNKIPFLVVDKLDATAVTERISSQTMGISLGAAWIFKAEFINLFHGRLLNLHGTCLPKLRGGGGFSWRIMLNDRNGCSLVHLVDPGVDTGDIVACKKYTYPLSCRIPVDFEAYAVKKYMTFLKKFLDSVEVQKNFILTKQDESKSTYWPRLATAIHGYIDWSWSAEEITRFICAFDDPYGGAMTYVSDRQIRLKKATALTVDGSFHPFQNGIVYRIGGGALYVAAKDGSVVIKDATNMEKIRSGDRFYTPVSFLEEAKKFRAVYTPSGLKK